MFHAASLGPCLLGERLACAALFGVLVAVRVLLAWSEGAFSPAALVFVRLRACLRALCACVGLCACLRALCRERSLVFVRPRACLRALSRALGSLVRACVGYPYRGQRTAVRVRVRVRAAAAPPRSQRELLFPAGECARSGRALVPVWRVLLHPFVVPCAWSFSACLAARSVALVHAGGARPTWRWLHVSANPAVSWRDQRLESGAFSRA